MGKIKTHIAGIEYFGFSLMRAKRGSNQPGVTWDENQWDGECHARVVLCVGIIEYKVKLYI